jgi:cytochrome P450/NADPH-cytochrome P450 reductase
MNLSKKSLEITLGNKTVRVSWYAGATDDSIRRAICAALGLPETVALLLRDSGGDSVAISDSLPSGHKLTAESAAAAPAQSKISPGTPPARPAASPLLQPRGPKPYPLVGNLPDLRGKGGRIQSIIRLVSEYGDFVRLKIPKGQLFINSDADVVQDMLSRPEDFPKIVSGTGSPLSKLREQSPGGAGLFTSDDTEEIWHIAHRVLLPALGLSALKQYYPRMLETADDLLNHLARLQKGESFLVTDLMTRMTFEAISYTGFNTRWGCIDSTELPPFVQAMVDGLVIGMESAGNFLPDVFHPVIQHKRERANAILLGTVDEIIQKRRVALEHGEAVPNDILQAMLTTRDKVTGKRLPDTNIRAQLITFLVAGHETTSGLLSYALLALAQNPEVERKLIAEVDAVLGRDPSRRPTFYDIEKLDYTLRILKEALRLNPTAPAFRRMSVRDTILAGKYAIPAGGDILTVLPTLHRNTRFWGDSPEVFDPDRFLPEAVAARHSDAYHPFGMGMRSCIGFQFALIEAKMVLARLYQRFIPRLAKPDYQLEHVETMTVKPKDLYMVLEARPAQPSQPVSGPTAVPAAAPAVAVSETGQAIAPARGEPVLILYGSNMGACQDLAQNLARMALRSGFYPTMQELDARTADLPKQAPVIIVSSTYNGKPPDNATRFAEWLGRVDLPADACKGVRYAVLGCGNKQWKATFQKFPRFLHERLSALGGESFYPLGACDADGDFEGAMDIWCDGLWKVMRERFGSATTKATRTTAEDMLLYTIEVVNFAGTERVAVLPSHFPLQGQSFVTSVLKNEELQATDSGRSTRHIEIALPKGGTYAAGDHLGVFPENPAELVNAVAESCGARLTDVVILHENSRAEMNGQTLPCGIPISVYDLLTYHIDLAGALSRKELRALSQRCPCPPERVALEGLATEATYESEVLAAKLGLINLLQRYKSVECDLGLLLSLRPQLKPRYYSISSSPRVLQASCSITVGVHSCLRKDGSTLEGLCSHYLAALPVSARVRVIIKDTKSNFRLPASPERDIILIGPGTGLAPLRGFIEERAALRKNGVAVGQTHLFFGCRHPAQDYIYQRELEDYLKDGTLNALHVAFSRLPDRPKTYVHDYIAAQAAVLNKLLGQGAYVYICGDARHMAPYVQAAFLRLLQEQGGLTAAEAATRLEELKAEGRYLQDVWAST